MITFKLSASLFAACVTGTLLAGPVLAEDGALHVFMDHARVLKLDRPVSKVIVGNSKIADATVADEKTIVLTGRDFGTTNLVLLDNDGNAILDERIQVSIDEDNTIRLFKSTARIVMSCTPICEAQAASTYAEP